MDSPAFAIDFIELKATMGRMEETPSMLHNALTAFLMIGGLITAALLYLHQQRNPPDRKHLTEIIANRSWKTWQVVMLLSTLFLLYYLAQLSGPFIGQFIYEDQAPIVKLMIILGIYSILMVMVSIISKRNSGDLGMGISNVRKLLISPVAYLAVIPFIMLASKGYHLLLERIYSSEVELQEVAQIVSGELGWVEILYMITAIFIAPVYEELLFRGIAFPYFVKRAGLIPAIVIVSVLFALMHPHLPSFVPLAMLSGTLCLTYWRTGSLWTSIGVHMIFNAVTILALNIAG
ncbi:type II CAAX endopeptidase family protein [Pontiellaceae bacterium B1224]|nr:type II CAAX endopeptidase family protein [Pontiellaceae bacterium B1224]